MKKVESITIEGLKKENMEMKKRDNREKAIKEEKEMLNHIGSDLMTRISLSDEKTLSKLTCCELKEVCAGLGLTKTGKKEDIISKILEHGKTVREQKADITDRLDSFRFSAFPILIDGNIEYQTGNDLISWKEVSAYVAKYHYDDISKGIVKSIAISDRYIAGKEACIQIVNNHYTEEIFNDIQQEIMLTVCQLAENGGLYINEGNVGFYGTFAKLYKAVYRTLVNFRNPSVTRQHENLATIVENDGEKITDYIIALNGKNAVTTLAKTANIDDIINNQTLKEFIRFMKVNDSSHFDKCFQVLCGRLQGTSFDEIGKKYGFSKRTAERTMNHIKMIYKLFDREMVTLHNSASEAEGCTYRYSDSTASGSYTFRYSEGQKYQTSVYTEEFLQRYFEKHAYFFNSRYAGGRMDNDIHYIENTANYKSYFNTYHTTSGKTIVYVDGKFTFEY